MPKYAKIKDTAFIDGWDSDALLSLRGKRVKVVRQLNRVLKGDSGPRHEIKVDPPIENGIKSNGEPWFITTLNMADDELEFE